VQSSADTRAYDAHDQVGNDAILHKTGHTVNMRHYSCWRSEIRAK